jgi:basic amino acid/polyamine antiporter, APA family
MEQPALARRLGTADAVVIGLGSMIGAGVFSAFDPAQKLGDAERRRLGSCLTVRA